MQVTAHRGRLPARPELRLLHGAGLEDRRRLADHDQPWPASKALQSPDETHDASSAAPSPSQVTTSKKTARHRQRRPAAGRERSTRASSSARTRPTLRRCGRRRSSTRARSTASIAPSATPRSQRLRAVRRQLPGLDWRPTCSCRRTSPRRVTAKAREVTARRRQLLRQGQCTSSSTCAPSPSTRRSSRRRRKATRSSTSSSTLQRGYFDYHASAMVVMLRQPGYPGAPRRRLHHAPAGPHAGHQHLYVVTEANAFAWPEVYFPGLGWVEFNPTPSEPRVAAHRHRRPELLGARG